MVCGDGKDGKEAVDKVIELKPDITCWTLAWVMNGMQAAMEIRRISPRTKILFLSVVGAQEAAAGARLPSE